MPPPHVCSARCRRLPPQQVSWSNSACRRKRASWKRRHVCPTFEFDQLLSQDEGGAPLPNTTPPPTKRENAHAYDTTCCWSRRRGSNPWRWAAHPPSPYRARCCYMRPGDQTSEQAPPTILLERRPPPAPKNKLAAKGRYDWQGPGHRQAQKRTMPTLPESQVAAISIGRGNAGTPISPQVKHG